MDNKLVALSQYYHFLYFPEVVKNKVFACAAPTASRSQSLIDFFVW
jgi:hypothetical protein